jgi:hypothetical protein
LIQRSSDRPADLSIPRSPTGEGETESGQDRRFVHG